MAEWQPIETAPRDGTPIWVYIKNYGQCEAWFAPGEWSFETSEVPREYSGAAWICVDDQFQMEVEETPHGYEDGPVTHWMPLPEPPE